MYDTFLTEAYLHSANTCQGAHLDLVPVGKKPELHDCCYVRQCSLFYAFVNQLSRGWMLHVLFIMHSAILNCLSLGSFSSQPLVEYKKDNMTNMSTIANLY